MNPHQPITGIPYTSLYLHVSRNWQRISDGLIRAIDETGDIHIVGTKTIRSVEP